MAWPDYAIAGLIGVSLLVGLFRGFIKETFSLAVWAAAFWVAFTFTEGAAAWLEGGVSIPSARMAIAFVGLFLATLLIGGLLIYLVGQLVEKTGLSGTDRLFGGVFGALRGLVLVLALLVLAGFTPVPRDPWWQASPTIQRLLPLAEWAVQWLPESIRQHIEHRPEAEPQTVPEENAENDALAADGVLKSARASRS